MYLPIITYMMLAHHSSEEREPIIYLAKQKQVFGKAQRKCVCKYCPNIAKSSGNICGALLDSRDIHLRTADMQDE